MSSTPTRTPANHFRPRQEAFLWDRHLHKHNNSYERLMLDSAFTVRNGRIINTGALVFMVACSRPLQFVRFLFYRAAGTAAADQLSSTTGRLRSLGRGQPGIDLVFSLIFRSV